MKWKILWLAMLIFMVAGCSNQAEKAKGQTAYNLEVPDGTIKGTLTMPETEEKVPLVIIVAGTGPTDQDGNNPYGIKAKSYALLAVALQEKGIASLRYDKRGIGGSRSLVKDQSTLTVDIYAQDVAAWVEKAKADGRFSTVILLGHSEGSLLSMMALQNTVADGFISLAGIGQPMQKVLENQLLAQSQEYYDIAKPIIDQLVQGNLVKEVPSDLKNIFDVSVQPYLISEFRQDPAVLIKNISIPILIIQGDNDVQVSVQDANLLHQANPASTLMLIKGMNHILKDAPADREENLKTYGNPDLPISTELVVTISNFVIRCGS